MRVGQLHEKARGHKKTSSDRGGRQKIAGLANATAQQTWMKRGKERVGAEVYQPSIVIRRGTSPPFPCEAVFLCCVRKKAGLDWPNVPRQAGHG